jgi:hypothetical protein
MRLAAAILVAAAAATTGRQDLFDQTVSMPRSQWRAIRVSLTERPATLRCRFRVEEGSAGIRAIVMTVQDTERFRKGEPFRMLAATKTGSEGTLDFRIPRPGEYMLLIDNRSDGVGAVDLRLRAWLDFHEGEQFARELSRQTRWLVSGLGLIWLGVAGGWPAWRIRRAWLRRRDALRGFHGGRL